MQTPQPFPAQPTAAGLEMIRRLVAFPTVSRDSNLELIDFVREYLRPLDADVRLTFDNDRRKANLFATLGAEATRDRAGIVLSGHTDVVPVEGQAWDSDPFAVLVKDERLYGRGTADMKSFVALALATVPAFVARGLKQPLHLAFSYDEELGCLGVGRLIEDLARADIHPRGCIVGEPTLMDPVIAHKGKQGFRCTVRGLASHSAYAPRGVNAVEFAAEAVVFLRALAKRHQAQGPFDHGFDVAHTTVHTGQLHGGTALNIVPHECWFEFEFRHLPGDDPALLLAEFEGFVRGELEPAMRATHPEAGFDIVPLSTLPVLSMAPEHEMVGLVQELAGSTQIGKVSYGTEGSQFQRAGIPAVVCGPGSILQAHKPNEWVALSQVARCESFLQRLIDRMCG